MKRIEKIVNIEIGRVQDLIVLRSADFGFYLGKKEDDENAVLLPKKQVPENIGIGDKLTVFVYRDSEDRAIATVKRPYAKVGEFAYLVVKSVSKQGAFLDWGLEKDLFLPFKEQEETVAPGQKVLVYLYLDKSNRISATTRIYSYLQPNSPEAYRKNDSFTGVVYRTNREFGAFIAVFPKGVRAEENTALEKVIFGLIPPSQVFCSYHLGDLVNGRVVSVREDGKLDLSVRKKAYKQIEEDSETVLRKIRDFGGVLPFSEHASPELIKRELNMSKNGFKKALGHLLKERKIEIREDSVAEIR